VAPVAPLSRRRENAVKNGYVSEFTSFINHFLDEHPEVTADQRRVRSIYWDRPVDLKAQAEAQEDRVPPSGYYYFELWPQAQPPGGDGGQNGAGG
jgi:hypothetical protein